MKTNGQLKVQTPNGVDTYDITLTSSIKGAALNNNDAVIDTLRAKNKELTKEKKQINDELSKFKKEAPNAKLERTFLILVLSLMVLINIGLITYLTIITQ